jgi:hypothetical protein
LRCLKMLFKKKKWEAHQNTKSLFVLKISIAATKPKLIPLLVDENYYINVLIERETCPIVSITNFYLIVYLAALHIQHLIFKKVKKKQRKKIPCQKIKSPAETI